MNLEYFIAKRISNNNKSTKNISSPIVNIAIVGIALGLCVMILSIAVVLGFKKEITEKIIGFGSHIQITNYDNNSSFETLPISSNQVDKSIIKSIKGVKHIQKYATKPGIIKTKTDIQGIVLNGVGDDYDWSFFDSKIVEGESFKVDSNKKTNSIIISQKIANLLNLKLKDRLEVFFVQNPPRERRFTITGIYNTGIDEFDKIFALCDIGHIQKLNNWSKNEISGFEILLDDFEKLDENIQTIREICTNNFLEDGSSLQVKSIKRKHPAIFDWLNMLDVNVWVILTLISLVAGFNMVSGLLIIIIEKTSMIGILKALGCNNWNIRKIFLYQSAFLISKGLFWGNLIGMALCFIQYYFKPIGLDSTNYYLDKVPIYITPSIILLLNLSSLAITICMLLIPSLIISKINPAKAIKFD